MSHPKLIAFAGSNRKGSFNQMLVDVAAKFAESAGAEVTRLSLAEFPFPIFDQDLEAEGKPPRLDELNELFRSHDGFLIACPEYNSSITPLLKNTIDWVSRPVEGQPPLAAYQGKVAGLLAASPGGLGGLRGLVHVRAILQNIGVLVVPDQFALSRAFEAFDDSGNLKDAKQSEIVERISKSVVQLTAQINP